VPLQSCDQSVKTSAPDAKVVDLTEREPAQLARIAVHPSRHEYAVRAARDNVPGLPVEPGTRSLQPASE
jgi:hypothetical protein